MASTVVRAPRGVVFTLGREWPELEASGHFEVAASTEAVEDSTVGAAFTVVGEANANL